MKVSDKFTAVIFSLLLMLFSARSLSSPAAYYGENLCKMPGYTCLKITKRSSWESLFANENQRALAMRINRMNVPLKSGMTIAVPVSFGDVDILKFSPLALKIPSENKKILIVDPKLLAFGAYDENGNLLKWGPVSMGKQWCSDIQESCRTQTGTFAVYIKGGAKCSSHEFPIHKGGAPMPYCLFFDRGYAVHASKEIPGYDASHGCVRVFYEDAKWLNQSFAQKGTTVVIKPYEHESENEIENEN